MKCGSVEEQRVLRWIVSQVHQTCGADTRVILFGSRARGDAGDRSDFDIAIEAGEPTCLSELRSLVEENPETLLAVDLVDLYEVSEDFRSRILNEGRDISEVL
jgi:predicted nucleotidyltransferase